MAAKETEKPVGGVRADPTDADTKAYTDDPNPALTVNPAIPDDEQLQANPTLLSGDGGQMFRPVDEAEVRQALIRLKQEPTYEGKLKLLRTNLPQIGDQLDAFEQGKGKGSAKGKDSVAGMDAIWADLEASRPKDAA